MGNHRFRLWDMMPNAWFYKLKDMGRIRNQNSNQARRKKHPPTTSSSSTTTTISASSSSSSSLTTANNAIQQQLHQPPDLLSHQRKSYYFTRDLTPPPLSHSPPTYPSESNTNNNNNYNSNNKPDHLPRKSQKQSRSSRRNRASSKTHSKHVTSSSSSSFSSVSAGCSCRPTADSVWTKPDSTSEEYPNSPLGSSSDLQSLVPEFGSDHDPALQSDSSNETVQCSGSCHCRVEKDIVINMNDQSLDSKFDGFITIPELELPPIITQKPSTRTDAIQEIKKKKKKNDCNEPTKHRTISATSEDRNASGSLSVKVGKEEQRNGPVRRLSVSSPGLRLRTNSPRIASKKIQAHARKSLSSVSSSTTSRRSLSESFAVMKSSADPQRDFRESMVEMILENNIRASKDLEDLLACYLQLNSDEYHQLIIKVFKQIWFDLAGVKLK